MRALITGSFVYSFSNLPVMLEGDGQRKVKGQWSLPVPQTSLRDAEVMEQVVTMRQCEVLAEVPRWGDGYCGEVVVLEVMVEGTVMVLVPVMMEMTVVMVVVLGDGRTSGGVMVVGVMSKAGSG